MIFLEGKMEMSFFKLRISNIPSHVLCVVCDGHDQILSTNGEDTILIVTSPFVRAGEDSGITGITLAAAPHCHMAAWPLSLFTLAIQLYTSQAAQRQSGKHRIFAKTILESGLS